MSRLFVFTTLLIFCFSLPLSTIAQDDDTGWPVVERCVGEPTAPSENWTFDGTILMTGYAGIHGVNAEWETPRVAVFLRNKDWQGKNLDLPGGALSPDGHWYASPYGFREVTDTWNTITQVEQIRVHELFTDNIIIRDWPGSTYYGGTNGQIHWLDEQTLVQDTITKGTFILNPFSGEMESWTLIDNLLGYYGGQDAYFSPDGTHIVYGTGEFDNQWYLVNLSDESITKENLSLPIYHAAVTWTSDSRQFFAEVGNETPHGLAQFDADGTQVGLIYAWQNDYRLRRASLHLSSNDDYLAFIMVNEQQSPFNDAEHFYIADLRKQQILDTCTYTSRSLSWSPTANQIALQGAIDGHGMMDVLVFDLERWKLYKVARQINYYEIIGWRAD